LRLDADLVLLSARNTAAGAGAGTQALSGLARFFFCAGVRSLLVSHWYVDSAATVALMSNAFGPTSTRRGVHRADAVRSSMLSMIDGRSRLAHPEYWAPFVLVGEGSQENRGDHPRLIRVGGTAPKHQQLAEKSSP